MPTVETCVLRHVLDRHAHEKPDAVFVRFEDGREWTWRELRRRVRGMAAALQRLGVTQGDPVLVWLPNGTEGLLSFLALNYIGAVHVPINTAYRGALLAHVLANSGARVMIAHGGLMSRLSEVSSAMLETLIVVGEPAARAGALRLIDFAEMETAREPEEPARPVRPWDVQSIVYTSGTTGPSKGVLSSYLHAYSAMSREAWSCVRDDDRFLINLPMFHIGGCFIIYSMLCRGGSIALVSGFKTDTFWQTVRETRSTAVFLLGVMGSFLMKQPPDAGDRDHSLRMAFFVPHTGEGPAFARRFNVQVHTLFNMTEIATPLISEANPAEAGVCGRPRAGFDLRLVDENDCEVPPGAVGELILRADCPWTLAHGYHNAPEATATAWRNGWFHTGDAFRRNADGTYSFIDRIKDAIRRRGENISSFEVEAVVNEHPSVQESAAIAMPSEWGEDEVMIVVAAKPGERLDPVELTRFLLPRMARFMVPRYVRIVEALPKTPTAKVEKAKLRADGITPDTWDREAAGMKVGRVKLD
jgi:crotonobetaine/carnitine-CoA ligase